MNRARPTKDTDPSNKTPNLAQLQRTAIFKGMDERSIQNALDALGAHERSYTKDANVFTAGTVTETLGLVLAGGVNIESMDLWGNRTILSHISPGHFFAETYALFENQPMLVDARTTEKSRILLLRIGNLQALAKRKEAWAGILVANLLSICAHKNLMLSSRSFHTAPKTVRGRVEAYLNTMSLQKGTREFDIPFDRQQLADYLNLDRTALSKELGNMRREGLIECRKNHFVLLT